MSNVGAIRLCTSTQAHLRLCAELKGQIDDDISAPEHTFVKAPICVDAIRERPFRPSAQCWRKFAAFDDLVSVRGPAMESAELI